MNEENVTKNIQIIRERYIRRIDSAIDKVQKIQELSEDLYALDLTVYSMNYSLDSAIYTALAASEIDSKIFLHPG